MSLLRLQLQDFRNIESLDLQASPGVNVLVGDNGAGKTSLLEAIAVVGRGRSFRSSKTTECIRRGLPYFRIMMDIATQDASGELAKHRLGYERRRSEWLARIDGEAAKQLSELARLLPVAVFEPNTQDLIAGGPDQRRRYLDWGLFHVKHSFLSVWREHDRILKQRNSALKHAESDRLIASLDKVLAPLAVELHEMRQAYVNILSDHWSSIISTLAPGLSELTMALKPGWKQELPLEDVLQQSLAQDRQFGVTRHGAHRDDLRLTLDGVKAQQILSRGQQKISALMLILAQLDAWRGNLTQAPLIILDDLTSELDDAHAARVLDWLIDSGLQAWVSAVAWPDALSERVAAATGNMFHVEQGQVRRMI